VLGLAEADHEESSPNATVKVISKLTCSLVGEVRNVTIVRYTQAHAIYAHDHTMETFACNYGLNQTFQQRIGSRDLRISGYDDDDTVRMVELPGHPFYISTLFVPQIRSSPGAPHPLMEAYVRAAAEFSETPTR
jgi:CTP synthase (UTP-ammonia lyase)